MSRQQSILELRALVEKPPKPTKVGKSPDRENPDQFKDRTGRCPPGFQWDGSKCKPGQTAPQKPASGNGNNPAQKQSSPTAPAQAAPTADKPKGFFGKAKAFALKKLKQAKTDATTVAKVTKDWGTKAQDLVTNAPHATKAFFTDDAYRRGAMMAAHSALTSAPGKLAKNAVKTVKHEIHEFQTAGGALKTLANKRSWKALDKDQKHALKTVAKHLAITIGAAAATASGVGIVAGTAKGLARHIAAKTLGSVLEKLHTAEELTHLAHLFHDAQGDAETEAAMTALSKIVEAEVARALAAGVPPDELEALAGSVADETPRQENMRMSISRPLNVGGQLHEWTFSEGRPVKKWADLGDGVQAAMNGFQRSWGATFDISDLDGEYEPSGAVSLYFTWEFRKKYAQKELGDAKAEAGGEIDFTLRELGSKVTVEVEARASGSAPWGSVSVPDQRKVFSGKDRGTAMKQAFVWLDKAVGDQLGKVSNGLYNEREREAERYGYQP